MLRYCLLDRSSDAELRALAAIPVPGSVLVSYRREPDYFAGASISGARVSVLGAYLGDRLVSTATVAVKAAFIDGEEREIGYLGGLRIAPDSRRRMVLGCGYRFLASLHASDPVPAYLATFIRGRDSLESEVAGSSKIQPRFSGWGTYSTFAFMVKNRKRGMAPETTSPPAAMKAPPRDFFGFWRRVMRRRQFAPSYAPEDFAKGYLSGQDLEWIESRIDGRLMGVAAIWDQSRFKQSVIEGYSGALAFTKPLVDLALASFGYRALPRAGQRLDSCCLSFLALEDDRPELFDSILSAALDLALSRGKAWLLAGFHESDPLIPLAAKFKHMRYDASMRLASFEGSEGEPSRWSRSAVPYLELGTQ